MSGPSVATVLKITSPVPDPPVGAFLDHGHHELEDVSPAPGVPPIVLPPLNQEEIQLPTVLGIYSIVFKAVVNPGIFLIKSEVNGIVIDKNNNSDNTTHNE